MPHHDKHCWRWIYCEAEQIGCHLLLRDDRAMHISFSETSHAKALDLVRHHGATPRPLPLHNALARRIQAALAAYATGKSRLFLPPFFASPFWAKGTPFQQRVWQEIGRIPYGTTRTYGELAARLGKPKGARAVGQACHANPLALVVPCHRVVAAHGPGGFAGEIEIKKRLLELEQRNRPAGC